MEHRLFEFLIAAHILAGTTGAIAFWVPVIGRKGGETHRRAGRIFTVAMLITGALAICMSVFTLIDPMGTHPHLVGMFEAPFIRGIFGWDIRDRLAQVQDPVLLLCGAEDLLTPPWKCLETARLIPGSRFEVVPGIGHAFPVEDPRGFADRVVAFTGQGLADSRI